MSTISIFQSCLLPKMRLSVVVELENMDTYRIVASSNMPRFEAHADFFRLLMKGIFDAIHQTNKKKEKYDEL